MLYNSVIDVKDN